MPQDPDTTPHRPGDDAEAPADWHARPADDVLRRLGSDECGLAEDEARRRLETHGLNRLRPPKRRGPVVRFLAQFNNVLLYVLLGSALVTAALGQWVDTGVILGVLLINAVIGFVQEGRAERALEAIRGMLAPQATVIRGARRQTVGAEDLVPGDVVVLGAGDRVSADLRLLRVNGLEIQESVLTGESEAVEKSTGTVALECGLGDRSSTAYAGTLVTGGTGTGVVVETGMGTEIGRISDLLTRVRPLTTPLLRQIAAFSRWLTAAILAVTVAAFLFGYLVQGYAAADMFMAAVGIAVAAIPEGLPPVMTITLAIGAARMARRNAIIRQLPAVETLGAVTVICSDKTGTLTRNEMTVQTVITAGNAYTVGGGGYDPVGAFRAGDETVDVGRRPDLAEAARAAALCNDGELSRVDGEWSLHGNPTDGALVAVAMKAGLDVGFERQAWSRTDVIPFDSQHKFMATLHHDDEGRGVVYIKGAPERILDMCASQRSDRADAPLDRDYWLTHIETMAGNAQRVLAVAQRSADPAQTRLSLSDVESGLTLVALFGLIDPPREEAVDAVRQCRSAGIRVKMVTGDHARTGLAVARQLGFGDDQDAVGGGELEAMDDASLAARAADSDVFARATPEHKLRLVDALQGLGHVVAMTGDGVNDAPALKRADIGIAMGRKGTEAAKEAAEMVLADDNFATIVHAVEEGRTVYDNLRKSILFLLPTNGGEALTILAAILFALELPITPVQILWVNMITAVTLGLAFAFEPPEPGVMQRPPRAPDAPILSAFLIWRIVFVSLVLLAGALGLFEWERALGTGVEGARTVAVNALVMGEIVYLFNCRRIVRRSLDRDAFLGSRAALIAVALVILFQLLFTYLPIMQTLFRSADVGAEAWLRILAFGVITFAVVEIEKAFARARGMRPGTR